jgi:pyroglutamyl-peptidase
MAPTKETNIFKVLLTGFGPFGNVAVNPSWEAVSKVNERMTVDSVEVQITRKLLPVVYDKVQSILDNLHKECKYDLVIHCGVGRPGAWKFETIAHGFGYTKLDIENRTPLPDSQVPREYQVDTEFASKVVENLARQGYPLPIELSNNAGRYLCEYSLFQSLMRNKNSFFLHVPARSDDYSKETVDILQKTIEYAVFNAM